MALESLKRGSSPFSLGECTCVVLEEIVRSGCERIACPPSLSQLIPGRQCTSDGDLPSNVRSLRTNEALAVVFVDGSVLEKVIGSLFVGTQTCARRRCRL